MAESPQYGMLLTIDKNVSFEQALVEAISMRRKFAAKVAENFDDANIEAIRDIARQEGLTDIAVWNKQDIVRALRFYQKVNATISMGDVGGNIKYCREKAGLTQAQLAGHIRVTKTTISRYESGTREPPLAVLGDIADACGVNFLDIILRRD